MFKAFQKKFALPLETKITVLGLRVETSNAPYYQVTGKKLVFEDLWKIQIACSSCQEEKPTIVPGFLEFEQPWEEECEWTSSFPRKITVSYHQKPRNLSAHVVYQRGQDLRLHLTLETILLIDFVASEEPLSEPESLPPSNDIHTALNGTVLDAYRLVPLPHAIIEFYQKDKDSPVVKVASNNKGRYACGEIIPGIYDIKVKHPRYLPLIIKNYIVAAGDDKSQDFLLRR